MSFSSTKTPSKPSTDEDTSISSEKHECKAEYYLVKVSPDTEDYKQYVNLASDEKELTHGREVELKAFLDKRKSDVTVYFSLVEHKENKSKLPSRMQTDGLDESMQGESGVASATTDEKGIATIKMELGTFGGDKFKAIASLEKKTCKEGASGAVESVWLTVWRRLWYQLTHHKELVPPSMGSSEKQFKEVYIDFVAETAVTHEKAPNGKVIVGSHNAADYHTLHKNLHSGQSVHVLLCDQQIDGTPGAVNEVEAELEKDEDFVQGTAGGTYIMFDPPLAGGKLFVAGTWENLHTGVNGSLTDDAANVADNIGLCVYGNKDYVTVTLPKNAKPSPAHKVKVTVSVNVASGPWGGDGGTAPHNLIKISSDDTVHTMCIMHELGHLMNMGPMEYSVNCPEGFEYGDHTKMYQSNGAHCYSGGSLVGGKGKGGTCIMYHQLNTSCTLEFCALCAPFVKAMTLTSFNDLSK